MKKKLNILVIEQNGKIQTDVRLMLQSLGYHALFELLPESTVKQIAELKPGLAILGSSLDRHALMECIHKIKICDIRIPILFFSNETGPLMCAAEDAFEGIRRIGEDLTADRLRRAIEKALAEQEECTLGPEFPIIIGQSREIMATREMVNRVADKDITVLVTGESGTGKELIARSIHCLSHRSQGPLVKINCGALPDDLLESEVFGFQKGAFTGAHRNKPGRFETAAGGTLFIDEIGDLNLSLQVKFLQVLEEKVLSRLGGTRDKAIDVRVVAATNADLGRKVREGTFRKDLFYRLNIAHIEAIPLRKRKEDIPLLVHYYLNKYCFDFEREILAIPDKIMTYFMDYRWPGNVRELENVLRRAIVLRDWNFIYGELLIREQEENSEFSSPPDESPPFVAWDEEKIDAFFLKDDFSLKNITKAYVSQAEGETILQALKETHWNRKKAAQLLKVSYKTLLNRINEYNLEP